MAEGRNQYDVGILFVHGIGEQPRADTLIRFGDPLCRWIERWCAQTKAPAPDRPVAVRASLRLPPDDSVERPYAELRVRGPTPDGSTKETYWLLAESWWAESFATPRYLDLVKWSFSVVPWTIQSHYGARVRRAWGRFERAGTIGRRLWTAVEYSVDFVFLLSAPFFAAALLFLASLLLLVALPPIPRLRAFLVRVQSKLAATIGDSYVLLSSPIQAAVIASQVIRDLEWLLETKKCRAVALVAHSQGAAVSHEALRRGLPAGLTKDNCLLFTFGSGLNKLEELRRAQNSGLIQTAWLGLLGAALVVWGALMRWFYLLVPGNLDPTFWGLNALVAGYFVWVIGMSITYKGPDFPQGEFEPATRFGVDLPWMDYYASLDPVPNGPLYDLNKTPSYLRDNSVEVHNRCAVLRDHNSYWKNPDVFVATVACEVGRLAGLALDQFRPRDPTRLEVAWWRRRWRVRWLAAARLAAALGLLVIPLSFQHPLSQFASRLPLTLPDISEAIEEVLPDEGETRKRILPLLAFLSSHTSMLAGVFLVAVVLAVYGVLYLLWKLWEWDDITRFFKRKDFGVGGVPFFLFLLVTVLFADFVLLATTDCLRPQQWSCIRAGPCSPAQTAQGTSGQSGVTLVLRSLLIPGVIPFLWFFSRSLFFPKWAGLLGRNEGTVFLRPLVAGLEGLLSAIIAVLLFAPGMVFLMTDRRLLDAQGLPETWLARSLLILFPLASTLLIELKTVPVLKFIEERSATGDAPVALARVTKPEDPEEANKILDDYSAQLLQFLEPARKQIRRQPPEISQRYASQLEAFSQLYAPELIELSHLVAPHDPQRARKLLQLPAQYTPQAAVALAELLAEERPEQAKKILALHAEKDAAAREALEKLSSGLAKH